MYELREADLDLATNWDNIVYSHPNGTIFHSLAWLRLLENNHALNVRYVGIYFNNQLVGILPLCIKKFAFIKIAASPFVVEDTYYMGPVIDPDHIPHLLTALDIYLKKNSIHFLRMISNQSFHVNDTRTGYQFTDLHTHILDIRQTDEILWKGLEDRCRKHIRKAKKSGIIINIEDTRNYIHDYYRLIEHVYHSQGMPCPNQKSFYFDLWDTFGRRNAFFLSAIYQNELIAGAIIILDRKCAYYLNGASRQEHRSLSPNNLLLWEACRIAKQRGIERFDFVGSDIPRLAEFKKSFGGTLISHSLVEKSCSKWIGLLRNHYPVYRKKMGNIREKINSLLK